MAPWAPWPALLVNNLALEPPPISAPDAGRRDQIRSLPWPPGFPIQDPGPQRPVVGTKFGFYVSCWAPWHWLLGPDGTS